MSRGGCPETFCPHLLAWCPARPLQPGAMGSLWLSAGFGQWQPWLDIEVGDGMRLGYLSSGNLPAGLWVGSSCVPVWEGTALCGQLFARAAIQLPLPLGSGTSSLCRPTQDMCGHSSQLVTAPRCFTSLCGCLQSRHTLKQSLPHPLLNCPLKQMPLFLARTPSDTQ